MKYVAYVLTFPECGLRTWSKAWWLTGGANEFQATIIEAEIEFIAFFVTAGICSCAMPIPFFFFFKHVPNTKKTEMTGSLNDHTVLYDKDRLSGIRCQCLILIFIFFSNRVDTLYSRTRAQFLTFLDVVRALTRLMSLTLFVIKMSRGADSFVIS